MNIGRWKISAGFLILLTWLNLLDAQGLVPLAVTACVLHEAGHSLAILACGRRIKQIQLTVAGAAMSVDSPLSYAQEAIVALAGPGVNFFLAFCFSHWEQFLLFAGMNFVAGCFNIIPLSRLDGGRTLFALLSLLFGPNAAFAVQTGLDRALTVLLFLLSISVFVSCRNPTLLFVTLWQGNCVLGAKKDRVEYCLYSKNRVK